MIPAMFAERY